MKGFNHAFLPRGLRTFHGVGRPLGLTVTISSLRTGRGAWTRGRGRDHRVAGNDPSSIEMLSIKIGNSEAAWRCSVAADERLG
jgi:hypothetical protein